MNDFEDGRATWPPTSPGARLVPLDSDNHIVLEDEPAWPVLRRGGARRSWPPTGTRRPATPATDAAVAREREVLALVAEGARQRRDRGRAARSASAPSSDTCRTSTPSSGVRGPLAHRGVRRCGVALARYVSPRPPYRRRNGWLAPTRTGPAAYLGSLHDPDQQEHHHEHRRHRRLLKAKHAPCGRWATTRPSPTELIAALGPTPRRRQPASAPGDHVLDVAAGSGNAAIPAARARRRRRRHRPHARPARDRPPGRRRGRRSRCAGRSADAEAPAVRRRASSTRSSRASASCSPRTTRRPPTSWSAWSAPAARIGLLSWTPEGFIGQMFATMKPYAPPPPARRPAAAAVGRRGPRARAARRPGHRRDGRDADDARSPRSRTVRRSATTSSATTGRRSPSTAPSPTTRPARPSSTRRWPPTATATSATARWSGSTCCSPPGVREAVRDVLPRADLDVVGRALQRGVVRAVGAVAGPDVAGLVGAGLFVALDEGAAG